MMRFLLIHPLFILFCVFHVFSIFLATNVMAAENNLNPSLFSYDVNTTESIIVQDGIKYRKVEFKGDTFYLELLGPEKTQTDLHIICKENKSFSTPHQVLIGKQITKRTSIFVEGLKQACRDKSDGNKHQLEPSADIQIGFVLDEGDGTPFSKKKLYINPGSMQIGVGTEF